MEIVRGAKYCSSLKNIMEYIAQDSVVNAIEFQLDLDSKIDNLDNMPFKFRKSIFFDNENIRDYVYMGYVIPYKIDEEKNRITVIGISKYRENL